MAIHIQQLIAKIEPAFYIILPAAVFALICFLILFGRLLWQKVLKSPFKYPYFVCYLNAGDEKKPKMQTCLDQYLLKGHIGQTKKHYALIEKWKKENQEKAEDSVVQWFRIWQFQRSIDDDHAFQFILAREETKYRTTGGAKVPFVTAKVVDEKKCSYQYLIRRANTLRERRAAPEEAQKQRVRPQKSKKRTK